jgi:uncharacterized OsmC-like protein
MNAIPQNAAATTVNGINVADVRDLIAAVQANSKNGMTRWRVTNTWQGRMQSAARIDGFEMGGEQVRRPFEFDVDEPLELGGANRFANPQEHLLAALNACMTVGFTALCALNGVEIETLEIVTEGDIDLRGFFGLESSVSPGYDQLKTVMTVKGSASQETFQEIFQAMLATSPNVHNITRPIALASSLVVA